MKRSVLIILFICFIVFIQSSVGATVLASELAAKETSLANKTRKDEGVTTKVAKKVAREIVSINEKDHLEKDEAHFYKLL